MDPEKPKFNWTRLLITIAIVLVTAGVVGGTAWYLMDKSAKNIKTANDKSVAELQKQIDELKAAAKTTPTKETTSQAAPSVLPGTVVNNFLTAYLNNLSNMHNGTALTAVQFVAQRSDVTDNFKSSVNSSTPIADPIILAQNTPPNNSFTLGTVTTTNTTASVTVTFNFSTPTTLIYSLTLVNNAWEINTVARG